MFVARLDLHLIAQFGKLERTQRGAAGLQRVCSALQHDAISGGNRFAHRLEEPGNVVEIEGNDSFQQIGSAGLLQFAYVVESPHIDGGCAHGCAGHGRHRLQVSHRSYRSPLLTPARDVRRILRKRFGLGAIQLRRTSARALNPIRQKIPHVVQLERLGEIIVHSRSEAAFAVASHRVGGKRDDRSARRGGRACRLELAQDAGRLETVHLGHLAVHQNEIESGAVHGGDGFTPVVRHFDVATKAFQHGQRYLLIHGIVFGQKHARIDATFLGLHDLGRRGPWRDAHGVLDGATQVRLPHRLAEIGEDPGLLRRCDFARGHGRAQHDEARSGDCRVGFDLARQLDTVHVGQLHVDHGHVVGRFAGGRAP